MKRLLSGTASTKPSTALPSYEESTEQKPYPLPTSARFPFFTPGSTPGAGSSSDSKAPTQRRGAKRACITLKGLDRLVLTGFPQDIHGVVELAVQGMLKGKSEWAIDSFGAWEWHLKGNLWLGQFADAITGRRLLMSLFSLLSTNGWHLETSLLTSNAGQDKDTIIFKQGPPRTRHFCTVSFHMSDKVRLLDWPNEAVHQAFVAAVRTWPKGVQDTKIKDDGWLHFKLKGNPWLATDPQQAVDSRTLMGTLLEHLEGAGQVLVCSIRMSIGDGGLDLDTWFFAED